MIAMCQIALNDEKAAELWLLISLNIYNNFENKSLLDTDFYHLTKLYFYRPIKKFLIYESLYFVKELDKLSNKN